MTHLVVPENSYGIPEGSTNFDDVFAYWERYWERSLNYAEFYPGIVDFEDGKIAGGSSKPSFPSKGIYPNKNMEKSRLFYGVRGVRQITALFKNKVDNRYPRVVLNHRMMFHNRARVGAVVGGIFYLATVDNYDKVEWWRTTNNGAAWQKICDDSERVLYPIYDRTQYAYPTPNNYTSTLTRHSPRGAPNSDDEKSLAYGSLPSNINLSTLLGNYGGNLAECAMKCRVYKGNIWAESDIIYANGTIEKNPSPKLTPPVISIAFQPMLAKRTVREPIALVTIGIETETEFTRTEEHTALSVNLTTEEHEALSAVTLETHESAPYAVKQTMTVLQIALESESTITRSEVMI